MFKIGSWVISHPTILAPMAGVTDEPFRRLCRQLGAGMTVSEMVTSDESLWSSRKSRHRLLHQDPRQHSAQAEPRSVQLAGNEPEVMASAARANQQMGADIIDLNMGCPAKKVCKKAAGSALLKDEKLVTDILTAVVKAVDVPVTLKIRTGWSPDQRNGVTIARIAEDAGISALAVHGRTRACAFKGDAEYDTIAEIANTLSIPVFANGDISSPEKAKQVLEYTGASAVMIGRAAQGNPWIFREINHYLATGKTLDKPTAEDVCITLITHLQELHHFYDGIMGVRIARKHVGWYLKQQAHSINASGENHDYEQFRHYFNRIEVAEEQYQAVQTFFGQPSLITETLKGERAA
jgi:tRNA-dihydrouridine synthase B